MNRMISYLAAMIASAFGWRLGQHFGPFTALFGASLLAGAALWATRRILHDYLDS
ncbi:MAG: hypothetical protein R6X25_01855 [Candidatus Krumholzibacteriia bacterium]